MMRQQKWSSETVKAIQKIMVTENQARKEKYKTHCKKTAGLIQRSGLIQALCFLRCRTGKEMGDKFCDDLAKVYGYKNGKELNLRRTVELYERKDQKKTYGAYEMVGKMDFTEFLVKEGFRVIKVTHEQQSDFMINFLNIGNGKVISPNRDMQCFLEKNQSKVEVKYVDITEVTKMYGAFHCATQAIRF